MPTVGTVATQSELPTVPTVPEVLLASMIAREVPTFSWFVLLVLGLIYTQQQWSRYSLNYLYNVSQDAGRAADISSRKLIIFTGIFAWNVALLMIGYSEHISFC